MAGAGHTVFEFTGAAADKEHRGSRGTFMGASLDLAPLREERENNLRSGPSGWIFAGVAVLLAGGITAYMLLGDKGGEPKTDEPAAAVAAADTPPAAPETKAAADETGGASGDESAGGAAEPAADDAKAPADDAKAVPPAPPAAPVEPTPAAPEPPKPASGGGTKSTGGKSTGGTKPKPKPKPEPKDDPKPSGGGKSLKPKKPPRDPLGNLPPPPG